MKAKKKPVKRISQKDEHGLTQKQRLFCREYIYDWNATRSYIKAYPNVKNANTAGALAHRLLKDAKIVNFLERIQKDMEKTAGISRLRILKEHEKLAFSSIAHLHDTWIERKEFENLTEDQRACIAEISTQTRTEKSNGELYDVEFVKIKLYDKQKALDSISKMLGFNEPEKIEHSGEITTKSVGPIPIVITTTEQQNKLDEHIKKDTDNNA